MSSAGRKFSNYPAGLDPNNTYTGGDTKYQVAELMFNNTEVPYPSLEINLPPDGALNKSTFPATSVNFADRLIGVQSVVVDSADRLWILDTGRAVDPNTQMLTLAAPGGPKLIGVNLTTNLVFQTVTFPAPVAYPDSYLNDVRFDLRPDQSGLSGDKGVAYITDSSSEGRNGIIVVDLTSGNSWRHLNNYPRVRPLEQVVPFVWGEPVYSVPSPGMPISTLAFGTDGNALGADGNDFYFKTISGRYLYSVPTERLRDNSATSELLAQSSLVNRGESGVSDGLETDSNGLIYAGNVEQGSISVYNPQNGTVSTFVRDPRLNWIDTSNKSMWLPSRRYRKANEMLDSVRCDRWVHIFHLEPT